MNKSNDVLDHYYMGMHVTCIPKVCKFCVLERRTQDNNDHEK
jgi:hypothetical protein